MDNQTMRLCPVRAAADLRSMYGILFGWGGIRITTRGQDNGTDFSAPRMHVDGHPASVQQSDINSQRAGLERRNVAVGQQASLVGGRDRAGRGQGRSRSGCRGGFVRSSSPGGRATGATEQAGQGAASISLMAALGP